ncbi:uncharacterized protein [Paramisgurnus dabryanus]|uniref:uncharacterized protein isoform X2 n=1 Tax=Paramisgurnus dabryanus TaxID=90735 RepID=UPI003CCF3878
MYLCIVESAFTSPHTRVDCFEFVCDIFETVLPRQDSLISFFFRTFSLANRVELLIHQSKRSLLNRLKKHNSALVLRNAGGLFNMAAEDSARRALSSEVESAVRALVEVLARDLAPSSSRAGHVDTENSQRIREASLPSDRARVSAPSPLIPSCSDSQTRVRQALRRQFPGMFKSQNDQPRGKKLFLSTPSTSVKTTDFQVYVLPKLTPVTPKGTEDLEFAHAGLGKRLLSLPDNLKHSKIVSQLEDEFPKLKSIEGGWMFYKSTGGGGQRKLSVIPTDSEGYSTRLLKSSTNNGKNVLYVVPLQEELSTEPLPYGSAEFSKMPQASCMKCGKKIPLQLLTLHVEDCEETDTKTEVTVIEDDEDHADDETTLNDMQSRGSAEKSQLSFPSDLLPYHASMCGEKEATFDDTSTTEEQPGSSRTQLASEPKTGWENEMDPQKACSLF